MGAAISRDGKHLAYSDNGLKMYMLEIDSGELRQLPPSGFDPIDWFPDGSYLLVEGIGQNSGLWKMSIRDGSSRKLVDGVEIEAAVSPDGSQIAYSGASNNEIWLMGADGEAPHRIARFDAVDYAVYIASLAWSPGGQRLVYTRISSTNDKRAAVIETCDLRGGQRTLVLSEPNLAGPSEFSKAQWLSDGRILYNVYAGSDYDIWAIATDSGSGKPVGPAVRLTSWARQGVDIHASADGKRLIYRSVRHDDAVYLDTLDSRTAAFNPRRFLTSDEWYSRPFDWTRDSKAVLFNSRRDNRSAILKQRIDQQTPEILLSGAEHYGWPIFSPNGDRLLYTMSVTADPNAPASLMSMPLGGSAGTVLLRGQYTYHCGFVPSARCVLAEGQGQQFVFSNLDPIEGKGAEFQRVDVPPILESLWSLSPDGNKILIVYEIASVDEVRILTLLDRKVVPLSLHGWKGYMQNVAWSADGSHFFATGDTGTSSELLFIDSCGNVHVLYEATPSAWLCCPVPSPDGHYLAYMKRTYETNVMMLEHF